MLGRTLHGGRRKAVLSALGNMVGGLVHILAAAFELSKLLTTSEIAFAVVQLCWGGIPGLPWCRDGFGDPLGRFRLGGLHVDLGRELRQHDLGQMAIDHL